MSRAIWRARALADVPQWAILSVRHCNVNAERYNALARRTMPSPGCEIVRQLRDGESDSLHGYIFRNSETRRISSAVSTNCDALGARNVPKPSCLTSQLRGPRAVVADWRRVFDRDPENRRVLPNLSTSEVLPGRTNFLVQLILCENFKFNRNSLPRLGGNLISVQRSKTFDK